MLVDDINIGDLVRVWGWEELNIGRLGHLLSSVRTEMVL